MSYEMYLRPNIIEIKLSLYLPFKQNSCLSLAVITLEFLIDGTV